MPIISDVHEVLCDGGLLSKHMSGYRQRDGQIAMAESIMEGYMTRKTVLVNAPTGNGKSIGGLVPAILSKDYGPTIVSTATKALQNQYMQKDLPMLHRAFQAAGQDFKSHVLKGRENYLCVARFDSYMSDSGIFRSPEDIAFYTDILLPWAEQTELGDFEELDKIVPPTLRSCICSNSDACDPDCKRDCFYKKNKQLAQEADIIVVNHDLLALSFSLRAKYSRSILPDAYGIIIDEAHKFEDIMTKYLGFRISKFTIRNLCQSITAYMNKLRNASDSDSEYLDSLYDEFCNVTSSLESLASEFFTNFEDDDTELYRLHAYMIDTQVQGIGTKIMSMLELTDARVPSATSFGIMDKKMTQAFHSIKTRCADIMEKIDIILNMRKHEDETVFWVDASKVNLFIHSAPISIAKYTNEWLFTRSTSDSYFQEYDAEQRGAVEFGCVTLMSATLCTNKNFAFVKNRLGISKYYHGTSDVCLTELIVPEVFDYRHQCLLYVPKGTIEPPTSKTYDKQVFTRQICQTLKNLSDVVDGGILALFTSYLEMEKVYNMTSGSLKNRMTFNQKMFGKSKLTKMFSENVDSVLYATSSFWEGVDIQGEALSCVIIDRLPFQVPSDPIIEARIDYIKRKGGDWFNDYYLPMMIVALQQGFGRLIRTKDDLGVVVLMDNRLLSKPYGRKILNSLPDCLKTRKLEKVEMFFEIVKRKRSIRKHKRSK